MSKMSPVVHGTKNGNGNGGVITSIQLLTLHHLMSSRTIGEAARRSKVSPKQISRWLKQPGFSAEYQRMIQVIDAQCQSKLVGVRVLGIDKLEQMIEDPTVSDSVKAKLIGLSLQYSHLASDQRRELHALQERVRALEGEL